MTASRRQARSLATAGVLLEATERVLRRQVFDAAPLASISREAGLTTGAIYSSFEGKADLLRALEAHVYPAVIEAAERIFEEAPAEPAPFCQAIARGIADVYGTWRGSLRSLALAARDDPVLAERSAAVNRGIVRGFAEAVASRGGVGLEAAAEIGFLTITSALRDRIVFQVPWPLSEAATDAEICNALGAMLHGYLSAFWRAPDRD